MAVTGDFAQRRMLKRLTAGDVGAIPDSELAGLATTGYVDAAVAALVDGAPGALDTLNELAAAIGDDAAFSATVSTALALLAPLASPALTGNPTAPTAAIGDADTSIASTSFVARAALAVIGNRPRSGVLEYTGPVARGVSAATFSNGDARAEPVYLPAGTITELAINCTIVGGTGSVVRLGLYADAGGYPGALIVDAGTVNTATGTGGKTATFTGIAVAAGMYWVASVQQGAATPTATVTYGISNAQVVHGTAATAVTDITQNARRATGVTGALPNPANWTTPTQTPMRVVVGITAT